MAEVTKYSPDHELGCGLMVGVFGRLSFWQRKTYVYSLPNESSNNILKVPSTDNSKKPAMHNSKRQRTKSETSILDSSNLANPSPKVEEQKHTRKHSLVPPRLSTSHQKNEGRRPSDAARTSTSSSSNSGQVKASQTNEAKSRRDSTSDFRELLNGIVRTHRQQSTGSKVLVRATSSNVMLLGHLGNLRQLGNGNITVKNSPNATIKTLDYPHTNLQEVNSSPRPRNSYCKLGGNGVMGNIVRHPSGEFQRCQGLMTTMDPEVLKKMGNDKYRQGRFEEALALYDRAISLDSSKATYRSNRSAALIGLGRLMEAVVECNDAIRLDPSYQRAHYRLAALYVRYFTHQKIIVPHLIANKV